VGGRSRGRFPTPATSTRWYPVPGATRTTLGFGIVNHSSIFCRAVPNLRVTSRNFCIAVRRGVGKKTRQETALRSHRPENARCRGRVSGLAFMPPPSPLCVQVRGVGCHAAGRGGLCGGVQVRPWDPPSVRASCVSWRAAPCSKERTSQREREVHVQHVAQLSILGLITLLQLPGLRHRRYTAASAWDG
jgi:hypothetical protein